MVSSNENMVSSAVARAELGKPGPPIGKVRFAALKRAMGLTGHYVLTSEMRKWIRAHPGFRVRDVYGHKPSQPVTRQRPCTPGGLQDTNGGRQHAQ